MAKDYGPHSKQQGMSPGEARARGLGAQHHGSVTSGGLHRENVGSGGGEGYHPTLGVMKAPPPEWRGSPQGKSTYLDKLKNYQNTYNTTARMKHIQSKLNPRQIMDLVKAGLVDYDDTQPTHYGTEITPTEKLASPKGLGTLRDEFGYTGGLNPAEDQGGGGQTPWWLRQQGPVASTEEPTASTGLGGGHFQVPIDLVTNQTRAAEGGIIGSVGGISRPKYQEGNMVGEELPYASDLEDPRGREMEGIDLEGAMMQSKEIIKELYDALTAQGLSPQEAMEKIKEIFMGVQAEEETEEWPRSPEQEGVRPSPMPQMHPRKDWPGSQMPRVQPPRDWPGDPGMGVSPREIPREPLTLGPERPMMGEEFPGQEFRGGPRAPAAFGGIMDTYTGRRKYGLGSFIKKALKKVKKLASSKLGKLAMMYAAGTYLGGMEAFGGGVGGKGMGWKNFGARLLDPMSTEGGISNVGRTAMNYFSGAGGAGGGGGGGGAIVNQYSPHIEAGYKANLNKIPQAALPWYKDPWKVIPAASTAAGLYTKYAPVEELDDTQSRWDEDKAKWDAYYAGLGGSYRVPEDLRLTSAQGGRIGRQEGGLMDLGGMEKDYRNDGGFVPLGGEEKADDVPARLSKNEFVFTADAVRNAGGGDIDAGAEVMENVMKNLEGGGQISEESQGQGAQEMFETSERLSEVI